MSDTFAAIRNALRRQVGAPEIGPLERFGMGAPTPAPQPLKEANFSGSERVAQALRGVLGNSPTAERFIGGVSPVVSAFTTDVYDDAKNVAQGGNPAMLAMALMPGAKGAGKAAQTTENAIAKAVNVIKGESDWVAKGTGDAYVAGTRTPGMNRLEIGSSWVPEELRGQGIGTALYRNLLDEAARDGLDVVSDAQVSASAMRVYDALKRAGYTFERNPRAQAFGNGGLNVPFRSDAENWALRYRPQTGVKTVENALAKGIRAYHGSPHDFDRFDMSKIGTGEGAQAYGHGLYFAEAEDVAKNYRDTLTPPTIASKHGSFDDLAEAIPEHLLEDPSLSLDKAFDVFMNAGSNWDAARAALSNKSVVGGYGVDRLRKSLDALEASGVLGGKRGGRLYEVRINAEPEDFLDWDKPLSEQSEKVQALFPDAPPDTQGMELMRMAQGLNARTRPKTTGDPMRDFISQGWHDLGARDGTKRGASETALREAGIPGIRYLDQGSRTAGEGSRNYVVFDDALIEILRKYGLLPPAAVGGAAMAGQSGEAQAMP